jgi:hypothetical protein
MKSNAHKQLLAGLAGILALGLLPPPALSAPAPCSLLTPAEVSAAIGASVGAGQPIATTGCSWTAGRVFATLSIWDATNWQGMKAGLPGATMAAAAGFGDDAYFATLGTTKQFTSLTVKKGKAAYVFKVYGVEKVADQMSIEKTLAGKALPRL